MLLYNDHTAATRTLLVQFDGSYKLCAKQGGAGTAAFLSSNIAAEWYAKLALEGNLSVVTGRYTRGCGTLGYSSTS